MTTTALLRTLLTPLLHLLVLVPIVIVAFARTKKINYTFVAICFLFYFADYVFLFSLARFNSPLQWNWLGKVSEIVLSISFIYLFKKISLADYGFTTTIIKGSWKPILATFVLFALVLNGLQYLSDGFAGIKVETLLYQATMPGIGEELSFRGVVLGLLNASFGKNWKVFGARMGWGSVITSVLFGLIHGLAITKSQSIGFDAVTVIATGIMGFGLAWARERSGSLIPGMIGHNIINFLGSF